MTICLFWTLRAVTETHLIEHESRANADLTHAFSNAVWGKYRSFVMDSKGRSREALLADPLLPELKSEVLTKMRGLRIAKVKIYNLSGLIVFSTDDNQIGKTDQNNIGVLNGAQGQVTSQITFREKFEAFETELNNRHLIASYVPARRNANGPVEGVFEVYSDVTELLHARSRAQWQVAGIVLVLLGTLYLFLFLVVRKADRIIASQEDERSTKERQIRHLALHDSLTRLPNRAYFAIRLDRAIATAKRTNGQFALMFIDLDRFKIVNDSLGHETGDLLLKEVSKRLIHALRKKDLLFRMGGDEFTVLLPEISLNEEISTIAQRIRASLVPAFTLNGQEVSVGGTIGISFYPRDGENGETLLKSADAAMYSAKETGRGDFAFYRSNMNQRAIQRLKLEQALRKAVDNNEFTLHYQPRVNTRTRNVVALEALIRWSNPTRSFMTPAEFIGVLEESGLMIQVGDWILKNACLQVCRWRTMSTISRRVSVNVSTIQFQSEGFLASVQRILKETGAPAELIELELTESQLIANVEKAQSTIRELKAMGLKVSIDDFGTGYSSLNYLRKFEVNYLKIDRSFASEITENARDQAVVVAIINLAQALDIEVVAEGVETEAQARFFTEANCHEMQGYLFSRPLPVERLDEFLAASDAANVILPRVAVAGRTAFAFS